MDEDSSIIMWINSTISDSMIAYFSGSNSSRQLWKSIEDRFARASSTHSNQLRTKLLSLTQGNKFVPALINEIRGLSDQLAAAGEVISDKELVVITLKSLYSYYIPFATAMCHRNPPVTFIELHNNLLSEEAIISDRVKNIKNDLETKDFIAHNNRNAHRGSYNHIGGFRGRGSSGRYPNPNIFTRNVSGRGYTIDDEPVCQICITKGHLEDVCD